MLGPACNGTGTCQQLLQLGAGLMLQEMLVGLYGAAATASNQGTAPSTGATPGSDADAAALLDDATREHRQGDAGGASGAEGAGGTGGNGSSSASSDDGQVQGKGPLRGAAALAAAVGPRQPPVLELLSGHDSTLMPIMAGECGPEVQCMRYRSKAHRWADGWLECSFTRAPISVCRSTTTHLLSHCRTLVGRIALLHARTSSRRLLQDSALATCHCRRIPTDPLLHMPPGVHCSPGTSPVALARLRRPPRDRAAPCARGPRAGRDIHRGREQCAPARGRAARW